MTKIKTYLASAVHAWATDNNLTPYILVDGHNKAAVVPRDMLNSDGRIVLSVAHRSVEALTFGKEAIEFNTSFSRQPIHVVVPYSALLAIYAKENGQGMVFPAEAEEAEVVESQPIRKKLKLSIVK